MFTSQSNYRLLILILAQYYFQVVFLVIQLQYYTYYERKHIFDQKSRCCSNLSNWCIAEILYYIDFNKYNYFSYSNKSLFFYINCWDSKKNCQIEYHRVMELSTARKMCLGRGTFCIGKNSWVAWINLNFSV